MVKHRNRSITKKTRIQAQHQSLFRSVVPKYGSQYTILFISQQNADLLLPGNVLNIPASDELQRLAEVRDATPATDVRKIDAVSAALELKSESAIEAQASTQTEAKTKADQETNETTLVTPAASKAPASEAVTNETNQTASSATAAPSAMPTVNRKAQAQTEESHHLWLSFYSVVSH